MDEITGYNWMVLMIIGFLGIGICATVYERNINPLFLLTIPASVWPIAKYGFHWHRDVPVEEPEEMEEHVTDWKEVVHRHDSDTD